MPLAIGRIGERQRPDRIPLNVNNPRQTVIFGEMILSCGRPNTIAALFVIEHMVARLNDNVLLEFYLDGSGPSAEDFPISQDQYSEL
jgi:hypothetical protein